MKKWFRFLSRKEAKAKKKAEISKTIIKSPTFDYHPKIILAWAKAIEGNEKLLQYLWDNGYQELVMAKHALFLKDKARNWLMENGYPHFMAMISAAEGDHKALGWLRKNNFQLFYYMAIAIEGREEGFKWINKNSTQEIFYLTRIIQFVKDEIEHEHNELHKVSRYS